MITATILGPKPTHEVKTILRMDGKVGTIVITRPMEVLGIAGKAK